MVQVLKVNKQGNKIINYECTDGKSTKLLTKDQLSQLISAKQVSNATQQTYKGTLIIRVKEGVAQSQAPVAKQVQNVKQTPKHVSAPKQVQKQTQKKTAVNTEPKLNRQSVELYIDWDFSSHIQTYDPRELGCNNIPVDIIVDGKTVYEQGTNMFDIDKSMLKDSIVKVPCYTNSEIILHVHGLSTENMSKESLITRPDKNTIKFTVPNIVKGIGKIHFNYWNSSGTYADDYTAVDALQSTGWISDIFKVAKIGSHTDNSLSNILDNISLPTSDIYYDKHSMIEEFVTLDGYWLTNGTSIDPKAEWEYQKKDTYGVKPLLKIKPNNKFKLKAGDKFRINYTNKDRGYVDRPGWTYFLMITNEFAISKGYVDWCQFNENKYDTNYIGSIALERLKKWYSRFQNCEVIVSKG